MGFRGQSPCECEKPLCPECGERPCKCVKKVKIELGNGKRLELKYMTTTSFWGADGKPITAEDFIKQLFGKLPEFYSTEQELRERGIKHACPNAFLTWVDF